MLYYHSGVSSWEGLSPQLVPRHTKQYCSGGVLVAGTCVNMIQSGIEFFSCDKKQKFHYLVIQVVFNLSIFHEKKNQELQSNFSFNGANEISAP